MYKALHFLLAAIIGLGVFTANAHAAAPFYEGKTIRIIVGFSAGGGYDTYSRLVARHMGKYIPGNPVVVVENMPGAGSIIATNYLYNRAKPDGVTIGHFIGGLFIQQLLGAQGIEFDARRFEYIGVPAQDNYMIGISKKTGIANVDQWLATKKEVKLGGVGRGGNATTDIPKILVETIGLPARLVTGYKGTADIRLAFNSGEVQGVSNAWESFKATWPREVQSGELIVVLQTVPKPHPDLPNVPLAIKYAKTEADRKLIEAGVHSLGLTARPYVLPPGTPKERVGILRKAFVATMKDGELLAEAKKAKLDINPLDGAELERNVMDVFKLEPGLVSRLKDILLK